MKKLLYLMTAMAFALPVGLAFADGSAPMSGERGPYATNGITYIELGSGAVCSRVDNMSFEGSGAGGLSAGGGNEEIKNGITVFDLGRRSVCLSSPDAAGSGKKIENGITVFN